MFCSWGYIPDVALLKCSCWHREPRTIERDFRGWECADDRWVSRSGCSIWAVELIRREIARAHPEAVAVNAVLLDFLLYDLAKEREARGMFSFFFPWPSLSGPPCWDFLLAS